MSDERNRPDDPPGTQGKVFRIDDTDLSDLESMFVDRTTSSTKRVQVSTGTADSPTHRVDLAMGADDDDGLDALMRETLAALDDKAGPRERNGHRVRVTSAERRGDVDQQAAREESKVIDQLRTQLARIKSETSQYRLRLQKQAETARESGHEDVFRALLPVFDLLDNAVAQSGASHDFDRLFEGVKMVRKQFHQDLRSHGLKPFDSEGEQFDPSRHEALQQLRTGRVAPGHIVQVVRRGYWMGDKLLRPALVIVEAME